jgi:hypothetical protein
MRVVSTMGWQTRAASISVAFLVLAGLPCAGTATSAQRFNEAMVPSILLRPAEADPVFQQRLVQRIRGPYERSHFLNLWALAD